MCRLKKTFIKFPLNRNIYIFYLSVVCITRFRLQTTSKSSVRTTTVTSQKMRFHENLSPRRRGVVGVTLGVAEGPLLQLAFDWGVSPLLILNVGRVVPLPAGKLEFPLAAVDGGRHGDVNVGRGQAEGELVGSGGVWVWEIPRGRVEGAADVIDFVSRLEVAKGGCFYHLVALCYAAAAVQVGRQLVHRLLRILKSLKYQ